MFFPCLRGFPPGPLVPSTPQICGHDVNCRVSIIPFCLAWVSVSGPEIEGRPVHRGACLAP